MRAILPKRGPRRKTKSLSKKGLIFPRRYARLRPAFHFKRRFPTAMPREQSILECTVCKRRNYTTTRNKKTMTNRLELVKFCPHDRKRTPHKEVK